MDVRYINPFISALSRCLEAIAGLRARRQAPFVKAGFHAVEDIHAVIRFAGDVEGAVVLSVPPPVAARLHEAKTGEPAAPGDPRVGLTVKEIATILAGGAKQEIDRLGIPFRIGIPNLIVGSEPENAPGDGGLSLVVPFDLEGQELWLQVLNAFPAPGAGRPGGACRPLRGRLETRN